MKVTRENSMKEYHRLIENPPPGPGVPFKPFREELYAVDGKSAVAVVRSDERRQGIREALRLIGGVGRLCEGVKGEIVIKPNCNTDDPFPRNSHPDTVRVIAEGLMEAELPAEHIVVGDTGGRARGLPTRYTMENMGLKKVADDLGVQLSYFEEEDWVTVKPPGSRCWPEGIKIPRRIYEADRVILTPVMDLHPGEITFTLGLKLAVGLLDGVGREWLHNGEDFIEKVVEINLAFSTDLVVMDGMKFYRARPMTPETMVEPGMVIAGSNRVATDAVAAAIMKQYNPRTMVGKPVLGYGTIAMGEELGLGSPRMDDMVLRTSNLADDETFENIIRKIRTELR